MVDSCPDRRIRVGLALVVFALTAWKATPAAPPPPGVNQASEDVDPLSMWNGKFRAAYARARSETLERLGPVIVVRHDRLILLEGSGRREATVIPPLYHRLKAVAHVPLSVFLTLAPFDQGPIAEGRLGELRGLRESIAAVVPTLETCGFRPAQLARQRELLAGALSFLDSVLAAGRFGRLDLETFARDAAPLVLANAAEAAALQIDAYDAQVTAWRRSLSPGQWKALRVVVVGRQLPRKGNVAVQYFARRLGEAGESPRLVYAEELSGDQAALELLGTHLLDREIGRAFFGDPTRMERDLLGDGAAEYLKGKSFGE